MRLNINTEPKRLFRQVLEIIRSIPPLDKLRTRELDVLSILMYYNYKFANIDDELRWRIIYDSSTKKEMQKEIGVTEDIFNNNLSLIRKTGLIDKDGKLTKALQVIPGKTYKLEFNFNIVENVR